MAKRKLKRWVATDSQKEGDWEGEKDIIRQRKKYGKVSLHTDIKAWEYFQLSKYSLHINFLAEKM